MKISDLKPHDIIPYGIKLMNQQDYRNAVLAFNEGLKHFPKSTIAFIGCAFCKFELLVGSSEEETKRLNTEIQSDLKTALNLMAEVDAMLIKSKGKK